MLFLQKIIKSTSWELTMVFFEILLLSLSLAIDCFAVSCVIGITQPELERKYVLRFSLFFGLFQGGMPFLGWLLGEGLLGFVGKIAPYIAFAILAFIGGKMIYESFRGGDERPQNTDVRKFKNVILLAVATSIDALAVGFGFAMIEQNILFPALIIGITSFVVSFLSYIMSKKLANEKIGKYSQIVGGIVLILIGVKILFFA